MIVKCIFCDEPRDGVVDHTECNRAGAESGGMFLMSAWDYGDEDY